MTSTIDSRRELYGIQMLRAVAACMVVFHHALRRSDAVPGRFAPDWLTTSMASGVDIFFILSGFIMLYVSFQPGKPPVSPSSFLFRRFSRIYPFYWFCSLTLLTLGSWGILKHREIAVRDILTSLILFPGGEPILFISWTLVFEIFFYLVFAIVLLARSKRVAVLGTTAIIATTIIVCAAAPASRLTDFFSNPLSLEFCLGLGLAFAFMKYRAAWWTSAPLIAAGFVMLLVAPLLISHASTVGLPGLWRVVAWGIPAMLLTAACLTIDRPTGPVGRGLVTLGDASYSIYLTHPFVIICYNKALQNRTLAETDQELLVAIVVATSVVVGLVAHHVVERPMIAALKQFRWQPFAAAKRG